MLVNDEGSQSVSLPAPDAFWVIADIFLLHGEMFLIFKSLKTCFFSRDHFSFLAAAIEEFSVVPVETLTYKIPLQAFEYCDNLPSVPNYYHFCLE